MNGATVILASGDFPRKGGRAREILDCAARVVCCDGAADAYRRHCNREPFAVVGDCDSLKGTYSKVVKIDEQDTNDLFKAVDFCRRSGFANLIVLGAFGKRDDHSLGNIFRALDMRVDVVTDYGRFCALQGRGEYSVAVGSPVSVFAPERDTRIKSEGLEWPLDDVMFENLYCATLNRTISQKIVLHANRRVYVYFPFKCK